MRIRDITVIFLALFIMLGGLAIPLWWSFAAPIISQLPAHFAELSRNITGIIDLVLDSLND